MNSYIDSPDPLTYSHWPLQYASVFLLSSQDSLTDLVHNQVYQDVQHKLESCGHLEHYNQM
jgi:hypothetical protein